MGRRKEGGKEGREEKGTNLQVHGSIAEAGTGTAQKLCQGSNYLLLMLSGPPRFAVVLMAARAL